MTEATAKALQLLLITAEMSTTSLRKHEGTRNGSVPPIALSPPLVRDCAGKTEFGGKAFLCLQTALCTAMLSAARTYGAPRLEGLFLVQVRVPDYHSDGSRPKIGR